MMTWLQRKVHRTWMVVAICIGIVGGVAMSKFTDPAPWVSVSWLMIAGLLTITSLYKVRRYMVIIMVVAGMMIGLWRGSIERHALMALKRAESHIVRIDGIVSDDVERGKQGDTVVRLHRLSVEGKAIAGSLWVTTTDERTIRRSDRIAVEGKLASGFASFGGAIYQAHIVGMVRPETGDIAIDVRDAFAGKIRERIDEPMASLGIGYLLGQRRDLPADFNEALQVAGLTHIVVASGYNLTVLVRIARRRLENISKYLATVVPLSLVAGFVAITGMSPSMSRAGLVTLLGLAAWYYGRTFHPVTLLVLAAAATVLYNPVYAWGDIGWLLSFAAFAGVMILAPLMHAYFFGKQKASGLRQTLIETVSAQVATAPVLMMAFGKLSLIAVISNILVLPLVPLAMVLVFSTGFSAYVAPWASDWFAHVTQLMLYYMVEVTKWSASVPWAQADISIGMGGVTLWYTLIFMGCLYVRRATGFRLHRSNIVE